MEGLERISHGLITKPVLYDYISTYEIAHDDLEPYTLWKADGHTRNLIFRNEMIELMLLCWNIGDITPLHTHNGQLVGWPCSKDGCR